MSNLTGKISPGNDLEHISWADESPQSGYGSPGNNLKIHPKM